MTDDIDSCNLRDSQLEIHKSRWVSEYPSNKSLRLGNWAASADLLRVV